MPLLAELNITKVGTWKNRAGEVVWRNTDDVAWASSNVLYVSLEGFVGDHYWDGVIATVTPPQYNLANAWGGHCRMSFGSISLSPAAVDESTLWPPPVNFDLAMYYAGTTEGAKETLFQGIAHLSSFSRESIEYELYGDNLDAELLAEAEDYAGDTVPLPRAFGDIQHQQPVRLPDVSGYPTYHKAYLSGTKGTDWHVYDDGVNIDANVTDNGDGTFKLSASPVGEVTFSGHGEDATLSDIVQWACDPARLNQNFDSTNAESPSPGINWYATSQGMLIDFVSEICAFAGHLTYIKDQTLYLVDMDEDNGSRTLTGSDFFPVQYTYDPPVSVLTAKWTQRNAVEETIGKYIKNSDKETAVTSNYGYGEDMEITPYHTTKSVIDARLADILTLIHKPKIRVPMPLIGSLPAPGEKITLTDEATVRDLGVTFRCRSIVYDFNADEFVVEGEGVLS